ncbi:MAG TPA: hypothetical protein VK473_05095 [Terriglobales bacterium]|nr:hypothetical protein [Terriglobales bacterium]
MMLAYRLVRLIETHSNQLAEGLLEKLHQCEKCRDYRTRVPAEDFRTAVFEIYNHLGEWLLGKSEQDIERRYVQIGIRREQQGVPLSELMYAIVLTRDHLWDFLKKEDPLDRPVEVFGELEMLQMLEAFFDKAIYYAAVGYEKARAEEKTKNREAVHAK